MIEIKDLNKAFGEQKIFKNFSLTVNRGEVLCLLGPSGCGKSTLLKLIAALDQSYDGQILKDKCEHISYVFQESRLIPWLTVKENLTYVLEDRVEQLDVVVDDWLKHVELEAFKDAYPNTLSGGMKQRVSLARAFSSPHDLLILDEPFQGLDDELKSQLMKLLEKLIQVDGKTVIMVTHDLNEARKIGTRIVKLIGQPIQRIEAV